MSQYKNIIPPLAAGGLLLTGCGDDANRALQIIDAYCERGEECEQWVKQDCIDDFEDPAIVDACDEAFANLYLCYANLEYCLDFGMGVFNNLETEEECADEVDAVYSACD